MEQKFAGFWVRFLAFILDSLFIWILNLVLIIPYLVPPLVIIVAAFYHVVFETSFLQSTPGKVIMNLSIEKIDGTRMTIKDSLVRFVVSFISSVAFCIGYFMNLFTSKKQTLHDFIARTVVIHREFENIDYWDIFITQSKVLFNINSASENYNYAPPINSQSLEELYNLYQKGILTEAEYNAKKEEFLKRL